MRKTRRELLESENTFTNHISDKGLLSKISELLQLSNKNTNQYKNKPSQSSLSSALSVGCCLSSAALACSPYQSPETVNNHCPPENTKDILQSFTWNHVSSLQHGTLLTLENHQVPQKLSHVLPNITFSQFSFCGPPMCLLPLNLPKASSLSVPYVFWPLQVFSTCLSHTDEDNPVSPHQPGTLSLQKPQECNTC